MCTQYTDIYIFILIFIHIYTYLYCCNHPVILHWRFLPLSLIEFVDFMAADFIDWMWLRVVAVCSHPYKTLTYWLLLIVARIVLCLSPSSDGPQCFNELRVLRVRFLNCDTRWTIVCNQDSEGHRFSWGTLWEYIRFKMFTLSPFMPALIVLTCNSCFIDQPHVIVYCNISHPCTVTFCVL